MDDPASESSSELSSIGSPPQNIAFDEIRLVARNSNSGSSTFAEGVVARPSATSAQPAVPPNNTLPHGHNPSTVAGAAPAKVKKPRKPREPKIEAKDDKLKEKEPRKPREPKVKNEDGPTPAPRKRQKKEDKTIATPDPAAAAGPRQSTLTEMVTQFHPPGQPASASQQPHVLSSNAPSIYHSHQPHDTLMRDSLAPPISRPPSTRPVSSGQNYDPIRSSIMDAAPYPRPPITSNGTTSAQASPHFHRASASPSIPSLIDPPQAASKPTMQLSYPPQTTMQQAQALPSVGFVKPPHESPTPTTAAPVAPPSQPSLVQQTTQASPPPRSIAAMESAMDVDQPETQPRKMSQDLKPQQSKASSTAPTPKEQTKEKKNASPRAAGTGLLASSNLFGGQSAKPDTEGRGVNIDIQISLNRNGGNTINIAQEIAKKYGRDAINPRATAHRQRLLQVAAAANQLEGGSADDISVDLLSDNEGDSNIEMGGMDDENKSTAADEKPRKRRKKVEEYDKEDDFIDDTELAWEEQAAVAKDGFFVYSGPLVPVGTDAKIESSAPTRGRGSGRGRGRGRGANAAGATSTTSTTTAAAKVKDPNAPTRGRGSRGGRTAGAPRKPRITKADREAREAEKAERERMAGGPPPIGGTPIHIVRQATTMPSAAAATPASMVTGGRANSMQIDQQQLMTSAGQVYANGTGATASGVSA